MTPRCVLSREEKISGENLTASSASLASCPGKKGKACGAWLICNVLVRWRFSNYKDIFTSTWNVCFKRWTVSTSSLKHRKTSFRSLKGCSKCWEGRELCLFCILIKADFENECHCRGRKVALWPRGVLASCIGGTEPRAMCARVLGNIHGLNSIHSWVFALGRVIPGF